MVQASITQYLACEADGDGFWLHFKRLERGRFHWPEAGEEATMTLTGEELAVLLGRSETASICAAVAVTMVSARVLQGCKTIAPNYLPRRLNRRRGLLLSDAYDYGCGGSDGPHACRGEPLYLVAQTRKGQMFTMHKEVSRSDRIGRPAR